MKKDIPDSLRRALTNNHYIPVIGWGYPDFVSTPWSEICSDLGNRCSVEKAAKQWIHISGPHMLTLYHAVANLQTNCIIAITPDNLLEETLRYYDHQWLRLEQDKEYDTRDHNIFIPLGGDIKAPGTMIILQHDFLYLRFKENILWNHAHSKAALNPLMVIGFDLKDACIQDFLYDLRSDHVSGQSGWVICEHADGEDRLLWGESGFEIIETRLAEFLKDIVRISNEPTSLTSMYTYDLETPYKHLDYFERTGVPAIMAQNDHLTCTVR
ncbi:hypothetical protein QUF76_13235 [Desulfobacterales bacterium HSG16]|nr:hypothetical protein [Desulfobacterales bacterium HSG16]